MVLDLLDYWVFFFFLDFSFTCNSGFFLENPAKERGLEF